MAPEFDRDDDHLIWVGIVLSQDDWHPRLAQTELNIMLKDPRTELKICFLWCWHPAENDG